MARKKQNYCWICVCLRWLSLILSHKGGKIGVCQSCVKLTMAAYPCPSLPFPASFSCFLSATVSQLLSAPIHRGTPPLRDPLNVHAVAHSLKVTGVVSKFKYVSHLIHSKHFESKYLAVHRSLFCWLFIFMFIPAERGGLCCITHQAKPKETTQIKGFR